MFLKPHKSTTGYSRRPHRRRSKHRTTRALASGLALASKTAEDLRLAGFHSKADKLAGCHTTFTAYRCQNRHTHARPNYSCHLPVCPFCAGERKRSLSRHVALLRSAPDCKFVVLSGRSVPLGALDAGLRVLWRWFGKLRKRSIWEKTTATLVTLEITFNANCKTWHPHLNVIFLGPPIPYGELRQTWRDISGDATGVHIQRVLPSSMDTLLDYIRKPFDLRTIAGHPDAVGEFVLATGRRRFIRSYGSLYGLKRDRAKHPRCCPDCGTTNLHALGRVSFASILRDHRGVYRVMALPVSASPRAVPWP